MKAKLKSLVILFLTFFRQPIKELLLDALAAGVERVEGELAKGRTPTPDEKVLLYQGIDLLEEMVKLEIETRLVGLIDTLRGKGKTSV